MLHRSHRRKRRADAFDFPVMDKNGIAALLLLILAVADVTNAASFGKIAKFFREAPNRNDPATQHHVSPQVSPVGGRDRAGPSPNSPEGSGNMSSESGPKASHKTVSAPPSPQNGKEDNSSKQSNETSVATPKNPTVSGNELNKTDSTRSTAPPSQDNGDSDRKGDGDKTSSQPGFDETCEGVPNRCRVQNSLVACIISLETGSKELVVQNEGDQTLLVDLRVTTTGNYPLKQLKVEKNGEKKMIMSETVTKASEIILSAGNGDCVLHMDVLASEGNFFLRMPSYSELVTPINGAYFLIATVLILGCTWACCKFRSRRRHGGGIPYQELEMGLPDSVSATEVETVEGWDQDWDDDWDDENAVKPPAVRGAGSISANGLTSRSTNKDGWEDDWDD